jgi:DNA-binding transcriptional MerR regulator
MSRSEPRWTLPELAHELALVLAESRVVPTDRRARDLPEPRTLRYYAALGLLDPPSELRGRTAYYGRRHLAQLVAIKRLQAEGLTLAEVEERLCDLSPRALLALAKLPTEAEREARPTSTRFEARHPAEEPEPGPALPAHEGLPPRTQARWSDPPKTWGSLSKFPRDFSLIDPDTGMVNPRAMRARSRDLEARLHAWTSEMSSPPLPPASTSVGVALGEGVQLLFAPSRTLRESDLAALREAAEPLLAVIASRELVPRARRSSRAPSAGLGFDFMSGAESPADDSQLDRSR